MARRQRLFDGLPPYAGGKRKLVGEIFAHVPPVIEAPRFIDAFLGGGSVSVFAKHRGYEVACNDVAMRSYIVGKALVENSTTRITDDDCLALFAPNPAASDFIRREFCPQTFITKHARFLDLAFANLNRLSEDKQWLMRLLLIHFMARSRTMGNWGARKINEQMDRGDWHELSPAFATDANNRRINSHPIKTVRHIARAINPSVCSNGQANRAFMLDVFDFLGRVEGDVVYLDPPYPATAAYETSFRVIDEVLRGERREPVKSGFSGKDALELLDRLLDACGNVPHLVLSYGNRVCDIHELLRIVRRHRPDADGKEIAFIHQTGLAGAESRAKNRELLVWSHAAPKRSGGGPWR